ncbi:MAG: hypothetical protein PHX08_08815 [Lachnospiraceae bacterium]|nr:hypothetical protein [Lachnospiraceae bacterium]
MAMIPFKCPYCSGSITIDDSKETGSCEHCGNKILMNVDQTPQVIVEYAPDVTELLILAEEALRSYDHVKANEYADKVLIIDDNNPEALFVKGWVSIEKGAYKQAISRWNSALKNCRENDELRFHIMSSLEQFKPVEEKKLKITFRCTKAPSIPLNIAIDGDMGRIMNECEESHSVEEGIHTIRISCGNKNTELIAAVDEDRIAEISIKSGKVSCKFCDCCQ